MKLKIEAARRQLGTALDLFIRDQDPVSVHCLVCGGCEVIENFVPPEAGGPLVNLLLASNPGLTLAKLRGMQREHWNAFKHATGRGAGSDFRDDEAILASFSDEANEVPLFLGWTDYGNAAGKMPIEAQVYCAWYLAKHPSTAAKDDQLAEVSKLFPGLAMKSRAKQKTALVRKFEIARKTQEIMRAHNTEHRALVLGWPPT